VKYVHAGNVLPADLVEKVRRHHVGLIYFPADHEFYERRRHEIVSRRAEGLATREIAERVHVSQRRVQQILKEEEPRHAQP
jgi:DNA-binding NarL/FixJ family response regulator